MRFHFLALACVACAFTTSVSAQSWAPGPQSLAPQPPDGAAATLMIPAKGSDGAWLTPNHAIPLGERTWHLRAALNVAALGCRDARADQIVAEYNAMLDSQKFALANADAATRAVFRARYGKGWADQHDKAMTRVYNFFAQPPVHDGFCAAAEDVLDQVASIPPAQFAAFADAALDRIEAPFTAFYGRYADYRVQLIAWQASGAPMGPVAVAAAAPVATSGAVVLAAAMQAHR